MTYERFKELWIKSGIDETIARNKGKKGAIIDNGTPRANAALIAYGKGDKSVFDEAKKALGERRKFEK